MTISRGMTRGEVKAISSKSDAHRALICAALSGRSTKIRMGAISEDIRATMDCLETLGAHCETDPDGNVTVCPMGGMAIAPTLPCKASGSTLRFMLPVVAALGCHASFTGEGRLPTRPLSPLREELCRHGIRFSADALPFTISGQLTGGEYCLPGNISSQYISGLLMALPLLGEACTIRLTSPLESAAYVEMTLATLEAFQIRWQKEGSCLVLAPGAQFISPLDLTVEGDWSGMAYPLVAGALGSDITVNGLDQGSLQADRAIFDLLANAGADITVIGSSIRIRGGTLRPFQDDVSGHPDLFPVLAVLAAGAVGDSRLYGGERLRLKESDRIATTLAMLRALGGDAEETADGLLIHGTGTLTGGDVDGADDHRIIMAAAVARALCKKDVVIRGAEAVAKSYPAFFENLCVLGGACHAI